MPQICWQTTFICGNYRGSGKPLKQLELLSRQADIRRVTGASSRQLALTSGRSGASNDDLSAKEKPASTVARLCKDCRWAGCGDQSPLRLLAAAASPQAPRLGRRADATPVEQFKAIRCLLNQCCEVPYGRLYSELNRVASELAPRIVQDLPQYEWWGWASVYDQAIV
jgi:hypothetical protein